MTKKIWRLLCIFSVFLAGILLYEGGALVFRFQARREGLLTCFAGGCAAVFYLAAFQRSGREQGETKVKVWKMTAPVEGAAALLAAGGTLYVCRYQDPGLQYRITGIVLSAVLVFLWQSLFSKKSRQLREKALQDKIRELFFEHLDQKQIMETDGLRDRVHKTLAVKREIWELRWCLGMICTALIAGLSVNLKGMWQPWALALFVTSGFVWISGAGPDLRCAHLIRIGGKRGESGRGDFFSALLSRSSQKMGEHDPDTPDLSADCIMPAFGL